MIECKVISSGPQGGDIVYGGAILEVTITGTREHRLYCRVGNPTAGVPTCSPYRKYPTRMGQTSFRGDSSPYWEGAWYNHPNGGGVLTDVPSEFDDAVADWVFAHGYGETHYKS